MRTDQVHPLLMEILKGGAGGLRSPDSSDSQTWTQLAQEAEQQGIASIVYRWASDFPLGPVMPMSQLNQLQAKVCYQTARNLMLAEELAGILKAFNDRNVPCIPMRGLALAESLYGDIAARPMGDVDLLVHREDLSRIGDILQGLGFAEMDRRPGFSRNFSYTLKFIKDRHGWIIVEPHWTIAYPPFTDRVDMRRVWNRSVRGRVVGVETRVLHTTDLLLHLCFHLVHRSDHIPLLWFYELDRVLRLRAKEIDWQEITRVALDTGQELLLAEALGRLREIFDSPIPKSIQGTLRSRLLSPVAQTGAVRVERRLARMLAVGSSVDGMESFAMLLSMKGLGAKLRFAWALLFPTPEFMRLQYGLSTRRQVVFSYVTRLGFLLREGLKGLGSLLLSERRARPSSQA